MFRAAVAILAVAVSLAAQAGPVVIDTPTAKIIVARPADVWSPDVGASEDNLEAIKKRRFGFYVETAEGGLLIGEPAIFSGITDHPVTKGVESELRRLGASLPRGGGSHNSLYVHRPVSLDGKSATEMLEWQRRLYDKSVAAAGDPDKAAQSVTMKKWLGGAAAIAAMVVGGQQMGAEGVNTVLLSGMADDAYRVAYGNNPAVVPVVLPAMDLSEFSSVEFRRVEDRESKRTGQIIIAYKTERFPVIEQDALVKAIVAASAMDESPEDVAKAQAEDFMHRKAIWAACVKSGECKAAGS